MRLHVSITFCSFFIYLPSFTGSIEPFTTGAAVVGVVTALSAGTQYYKCKFYECCNDQSASEDREWIRFNKKHFLGLETDLLNLVHGQPLVRQIIHKAIKSHVLDDNPRKPLVMSFHGWTGGGKNHVCSLIAKHLYKEGMESKFVHLIRSTEWFKDESRATEYKEKLQQFVGSHVKSCGRQLFIFDEVDKMPVGVIDALHPYLEFQNNNDIQKAIYIFLSNTGGSDIARISYTFWSKGKTRAEITLKDMEGLIENGAFNERGGLQRSYIIEKNLIDFHVPFFPLERRHVKLCVKDFMRERFNRNEVSEKFLENVADELDYYPPDIKLYSKSGCKKVSSKTKLLFDE